MIIMDIISWNIFFCASFLLETPITSILGCSKLFLILLRPFSSLGILFLCFVLNMSSSLLIYSSVISNQSLIYSIYFSFILCHFYFWKFDLVFKKYLPYLIFWKYLKNSSDTFLHVYVISNFGSVLKWFNWLFSLNIIKVSCLLYAW